MLFWLALACSGSDGGDPDGSTDAATDTPSITETGAGDTGTPTGSTTGDPCEVGELIHVPTVGSNEEVPLEDGLTLVLQQGPQGGYHIDMNGSLEPVPDVGVVVLAEVLLDDGTQIAFADGAQAAFLTWSDCRGVYTKARMFWNSELDAPELCDFAGRAATMTQTVEDLATGRTVSASFDVVFDVVLFDRTCDDVK